MTTPNSLAERLAEVLPCFAAGDCYPDPSRPDRGVSIHDEDCPVSFRPAVLALIDAVRRETIVALLARVGVQAREEMIREWRATNRQAQVFGRAADKNRRGGGVS